MKRLILYRYLLAIIGCSGLFSCTKDSDYIKQVDYNTIGLLIGDNFNLSTFNAGMRPLGLQQTLQEKGPYTVLVPSDQAFQNNLLSAQTLPLLASKDLSRLMQYHVIKGTYDLRKLPFLFNQEIRSNGGKLYVTHWVKEGDTVLTINGARVLSSNIPASNGLIHVINRVLSPYKHDDLLDAIQDNNSLSFFREAIRVAGLEALLQEPKEYTVFAPTNDALKEHGWISLEYIRAQHPQDLAAVLRYHIVPSRRFVYDYTLIMDKTNKTKQAMLNGYTIDVYYVSNPYAFPPYEGLQLQGPGNINPIKLASQDVLTGNGVLHSIGGVLKSTR